MTRAPSPHNKPVSILHELYLFLRPDQISSSKSDSHNNQPESTRSRVRFPQRFTFLFLGVSMFFCRLFLLRIVVCRFRVYLDLIDYNYSLQEGKGGCLLLKSDRREIAVGLLHDIRFMSHCRRAKEKKKKIILYTAVRRTSIPGT